MKRALWKFLALTVLEFVQLYMKSVLWQVATILKKRAHQNLCKRLPVVFVTNCPLLLVIIL